MSCADSSVSERRAKRNRSWRPRQESAGWDYPWGICSSSTFRADRALWADEGEASVRGVCPVHRRIISKRSAFRPQTRVYYWPAHRSRLQPHQPESIAVRPWALPPEVVPISASLQATIAIHPTGNEPSTRRSQNCLKQKTKWKINSFVFRYTQLLLYIDLELNWWIYYNDLEKIKACFFFSIIYPISFERN